MNINQVQQEAVELMRTLLLSDFQGLLPPWIKDWRPCLPNEAESLGLSAADKTHSLVVEVSRQLTELELAALRRTAEGVKLWCHIRLFIHSTRLPEFTGANPTGLAELMAA